MNLAATPKALCAQSPLRELLDLHDNVQAPGALAQNLGDGLLLTQNPIFGRIRKHAIDAGYRPSMTPPAAYRGWPLVSLDLVLQERVLPYVNNRAGLEHLERSNPGHFCLKDLMQNRPTPNYLLHEAAHGIAFDTLVRSQDATGKQVTTLLRMPERLPDILLGESFAMATEYLASCCIQDEAERWFFSLNSYRHHTPARKTILRLMENHSPELAGHLLLLAFYEKNALRPPLTARSVNQLAEMHSQNRLKPKLRKKLLQKLPEITRMNPGFLKDTTRLFLGSLGYGKKLKHVFCTAPLEAAMVTRFARCSELVSVWGL